MHRDLGRVLPVLAVVAIVLAGCGGGGRQQASATGDPEADRRADMRVNATGSDTTQTLYERLGGEEAIARFVDDFTDRTIADPRVNFARENVRKNMLATIVPWTATPENVARFKQHMVKFLVLASGGPAEYTGRPMREVHADMRISNAEFDAMIGDAKASLQRLGFAAREQRDVLAILETTRKQIVERQ